MSSHGDPINIAPGFEDEQDPKDLGSPQPIVRPAFSKIEIEWPVVPTHSPKSYSPPPVSEPRVTKHSYMERKDAGIRSYEAAWSFGPKHHILSGDTFESGQALEQDKDLEKPGKRYPTLYQRNLTLYLRR